MRKKRNHYQINKKRSRLTQPSIKYRWFLNLTITFFSAKIQANRCLTTKTQNEIRRRLIVMARQGRKND